MIRKILKWIGILLGSLVGLVVLAVVILYVAGGVIWNRTYENYDVSVEAVPIPTGEAAIFDGRHIATIHYCAFCHGENLAGKVLLDAPALAVAFAPNLTGGAGGVGATNTSEDWVRAIRHGVGHDSRGLVAMPSIIWYYLSDEDLGALIAYLQSLPPVDNELPARRIGPLGRLMVALGQFPPTGAAVIDHHAPRPAAREPGITVAYGEYLAQSTCSACHGVNLNGGSVRGLDGELEIALNLTPGGELAGWSEAEFMTALRSGVTPSGRVLSDTMPWKYVGQMTDEELRAVWLYLQSLPALEQGLERTDR
jgi:mono/diheme cytochrome c family protein